MPTINEQVATRIKNCAPAVEDRVVDVLAEKEVARRVELIVQGLGKADDAEKEIRKFSKPDVEQFDGEGNPVATLFSKDRTDARKKLNEKIVKLEKAIEKAVDGDIGDLANLIQNKGDAG
jgi:hypothetical protein